MAITRFQTYLNEAEEQEEKKKKKVQSFREWAAQQEEEKPKEEEPKTVTPGKVQSFRQWASDNGQAPAVQPTNEPDISNEPEPPKRSIFQTAIEAVDKAKSAVEEARVKQAEEEPRKSNDIGRYRPKELAPLRKISPDELSPDEVVSPLDSLYNNGTIDRAKTLAAKGTLSADEKKEAREIQKEIDKVTRTSGVQKSDQYGELTDLNARLYAKSSKIGGLFYGAINALGLDWLTDRASDAVGEVIGLQPETGARELAEIAQKNNPLAYAAGNVAGNVMELSAISGAVGKALQGAEWFTKLAPWVQKAASSAITFGISGAASGIANTETKEEWDERERQQQLLAEDFGASYTPREYSIGQQLGKVGISAATGAASGTLGSMLGSAFGAGTSNILVRNGLQYNNALRAIAAGINGVGFSIGSTAAQEMSKYLQYPEGYNPDAREIGTNLAVAFLFSTASSVLGEAKSAKANKEALLKMMDELAVEYETAKIKMAGMTGDARIAEAQKALALSQRIRTSLATSPGMSGVQNEVKALATALDIIDDQMGAIAAGGNGLLGASDIFSEAGSSVGEPLALAVQRIGANVPAPTGSAPQTQTIIPTTPQQAPTFPAWYQAYQNSPRPVDMPARQQPTLQLPTPPTPAQTQQGNVDTAPALPVPQNAPQAPVAAETKRPPVPEQGLKLPAAEEKAPVQESKLRLKSAEETEIERDARAIQWYIDFANSERAAENNTQTERKALTGAARLNAARGESELRLPTEAKLTLKGTNNNGQTETSRNAGKIVLGGSGERESGLRAGEQAGQVGRSPEGWRTLSRPEKAAARRAYADDVGVPPVQAKSLGVTAAAEDSTVRVYPREAWEPDLQRIAGKVEKATGKPVTFVLGAMKVNADGVALTVRGVNTGKGIIVQADDPSISAEKIATHEAFHAFAAQDPELSAQVLKQIRQQFPENRLREIAGIYLDKLYGIVDLDSTDKSVISKALERVRDEICADAYAGINAFAASADEYTGAARQAVTEARREAAAATERKTGPPERYSATDSDTAYLAAVEAGDMETYNRTALITEDTVDKWLKDYAAKSSPKYAQAYITRMTPKQFVDLTTSTTGRLLIGNQTGALDAEKLIEATRDQPLQIQISEGKVVGHEGRHRATALSRAGINSIPVLVFDYSNKYSKTDVPEMTLQGQDFGHSRSYATETLRDLIPLSYENRDRIVQEYGTQSATERLQEKYNGQNTIRFSTADDEEYIPESAAEYGQLKRQGKYKAPKITKPVSKSTATIAKADLRKALLTAYSIPGGSRGEIGKMIDALADQYLKNRSISWNDREDLINKLWESGVMHMEADDGYQAVRELVNRGRIYVPERIKNEFGDDWNSFRREAMGQGIYLVNDESAAGWDQWNAELSDAFPGIFPEDEYDGKNFLERVVDLARKGKGENLTLAEYAAKTGGLEYATEEDMMDNLERQADYALKAFAEKANLEIYLKDRTGAKIAQERQRMGELLDKAVARERERGDKRVQAAKESGANALAKEKQREEDRRQKEREHRKEVAQRLRERQAMRELQQKTLKQLQWLSRNQNKFPAEAKKQVQDLLEDMDVLAVSTAEEMHIDNATGKTWKDLRDMYLEAKEKDPNWMPSAQLEKIVMRLDAKKIGDLDMGALQDLYKAAIGLRTELYNRNNLINDELHRTLDEVYESAKTEIQEAKGGFKAGLAQRYADMQLTPMNRFLKMAGWNPDSTWYGMAKGLEAGERAQRKFKTESQRQIAPVLEQYRDWMKTADGQGKNAKWYEIKVPESWEYHMGDKPIFSDKTVTVYMTPAQKVHMYLESKNPDNLRHMEGGRTFADKELYSKGKRAAAFANGTTVRLLPETVKSIVNDLTAEEQALANALEQYYNNYSKQEINKVSNILYGYDKAMGGYYAPIFTNDNYTKSDPGVFDLTAEGVGNLKARQHAANPSWNISAFDAFERSVDRTGKFVGLAIPIRNMNTLWNWRESGNSMKDVVSHKWNKPGTQFVSDLMTELQSGRDITHPKIEQLTNAALSRYIGATFGFNPSIVLKQFASFPLAGTYLGYDNLIKGILRPAADTDLISKYTGELDYRLLGYATPETATLKNNPNKLQEKGFLNFVFGGGAITWMDGLTVRTLWNGAEQKVKSEQPDLEVGTQEQIDAGQSPFYQAVAKEFEEAVSRSQPMYDTMHRADVMREGDPITRTFTLFKTVPMQELNMLAQTIGEANYYKSIGADKATQTAARQKAGRAFLGILTGNLMIGVISFLNALLKNKAKAYRDKDGELTEKSVITSLLKQYAKDAAGLALGGSEAADILSAILFGDKWYGLETPGIEQLSSIIEKTIKASTKIANMVKDSVDVLENGGDWFQYMRDHGGDYVSSVEEIVRMLATYGTGLPVDNVKAYLLGAAQHISPYIKTAYEDVVSKADKSGLKGMKGAALEMRTGHILQDRAGETSERTVETIAGLYEAGYTDAVPATIQSSYSVNGETRKLSAAEDQLYRQVWRDSVSGALDDLTRDKVFRNMGQEDQAKVLKKLYDYGAQNAKETVWPDYSPDKWVTTAKDMEAKDVPLSEWLPIQQALSKISGKNKKQDIKDYIDSLPYSRDQKKAMYTAEGYQDADEVNWHSGSYGGSSGKGKTYAPVDTSKLQLPPSARMNEQDRELWDMESHGGNVNLRTRKTIPVTRDNIETVRGWGMDSNVGDYMTAASQTYRDGDRAVVVTPILPDGSLMTQKELDAYMDSLRGSADYADADDRGIILGVFDEGTWQQNLKESDAFAERIHELHEEREEQRKTSGLKLPSTPKARTTQSGLKLQSAPAARPSGGLRLK